MATAPSKPSSVSKRAVIVSINDLEVLRFGRFRLAYNDHTNRGSISLTFEANIANLSGRSQLVLRIPPESVQECTLAMPSNVSLFSNDWINLLPAWVPTIKDVITLSLTLSTPGTVRCPPGIEHLYPADPLDLNFDIFAKICKSRSLNIHFSTRQFEESGVAQLEAFSLALQKKCVQEDPFDYARQNVVERDWRAFGLFLEPPPYTNGPTSNQGQQSGPPLYYEGSSSTTVGRKRYRGSISLNGSDSDERQKRPRFTSPSPFGCPTEVNTPSTQTPRLAFPSPGSPTEANTPSILSLSPSSIRPTQFTHTSPSDRIDRESLERIAQRLCGVSDNLIREVLIQSGHRHLLASPGGTAIDSRSESRNSGSAKAKCRLRHYIRQYVDVMIDTRIMPYIGKTVNTAVSEATDQILDFGKTKEAEVSEVIDDGITEIQIKADECSREIEDITEKCTYRIEDQGEQCMNDIEEKGIEVEMAVDEKVAKFKRWLSAPAQSLINELHTNSRRSSI
ncbi:uncharacterized protein BO97DRAFT_418079 [Aspergillus homomorphus CBS 101889]|uniref:Uncharacterized protein n=1 Tax=Aspergillus homomorphus (strain CBS 101889) TaxID=1450537 RepID=A0A395HL62_ASPHC|nr:hypothetical protein BO97DRAFT_418079 [Aspergillus homomorphus CBS 101889]RAL07965.1 hypothetical protein BO97DRAFT_418079 [Aspergillus homomorphus CBS 101889]